MDYIFFARVNTPLQQISPNNEEISETKWVGRQQLKNFIDERAKLVIKIVKFLCIEI